MPRTLRMSGDDCRRQSHCCKMNSTDCPVVLLIGPESQLYFPSEKAVVLGMRRERGSPMLQMSPRPTCLKPSQAPSVASSRAEAFPTLIPCGPSGNRMFGVEAWKCESMQAFGLSHGWKQSDSSPRSTGSMGGVLAHLQTLALSFAGYR